MSLNHHLKVYSFKRLWLDGICKGWEASATPFVDSFVWSYFNYIFVFILLNSTVDFLPPSIVYCPANIYTSMEIGTTEIAVTWITPYAFDHSGAVTIYSSHEAGQFFPVGSTYVVYRFEDESRNRAECNFTVNVVHGKFFASCRKTMIINLHFKRLDRKNHTFGERRDWRMNRKEIKSSIDIQKVRFLSTLRYCSEAKE